MNARMWGRRASVLRASVVFNDHSAGLPCTVENMSASGAQLVFAAAVELPARFQLEILQLSLKVDAHTA
jgi:hypothetical protein